MTHVAADQIENRDLRLEDDAGGMAHVHVEDDHRPLCSHRKLVTADSSTLPASTSFPDDLCWTCRSILEAAAADETLRIPRSRPQLEHTLAADTFSD